MPCSRRSAESGEVGWVRVTSKSNSELSVPIPSLDRRTERTSPGRGVYRGSAPAPSLVESVLFGQVRGAFTEAASDKKGRLELGDGRVLFLDEVGDISPELRADLFARSGDTVRGAKVSRVAMEVARGHRGDGHRKTRSNTGWHMCAGLTAERFRWRRPGERRDGGSREMDLAPDPRGERAENASTGRPVSSSEPI